MTVWGNPVHIQQCKLVQEGFKILPTNKNPCNLDAAVISTVMALPLLHAPPPPPPPPPPMANVTTVQKGAGTLTYTNPYAYGLNLTATIATTVSVTANKATWVVVYALVCEVVHWKGVLLLDFSKGCCLRCHKYLPLKRACTFRSRSVCSKCGSCTSEPTI